MRAVLFALALSGMAVGVEGWGMPAGWESPLLLSQTGPPDLLGDPNARDPRDQWTAPGEGTAAIPIPDHTSEVAPHG